MPNKKAKRRPRVDFSNVDDVDAVIHAEMGLYSRAIGEQIGLTAGQAQYTVAKGGASQARRDWRSGKSSLYRKLSGQVLKDLRPAEQKRLMREYARQRDQQVKERGKLVRAKAARAKARRR